MSDALDPASMVEAAQKAAGDGDYLAAERLLREAAAIQEASLGASHPDLASTLNNLAFVCERTNKFDEAERGYRRAHAIAVASLSPGHPLIATSLKNLVEFCAAHEIPIWKPPATPTDDEPPPLDADDGAPAREDSAEPVGVPPEIAIAPDDRPEPVSVTPRLTPRTIGVAALVVAAIVALLVMRQGEGGKGEGGKGAVATDTPRPVPQATSKTTPVPPRESQPAVVREQPPEVRKAPTTKAPPTKAPPKAPVTVLKAQLCSALAKRGSPDWQCTPLNGEQRPGTYFFYTRLLSNAGTTVEHRWYRGERLHQVMRLRVAASPGTGYRTFSGNTVSAERAGDWRVELRTADGTLVDQASFRVR